MGLWKRADVNHIIARIIRKLHRKHGGFIHHRKIEAEMLEDPSASNLVRAVHKNRVDKRTPEWEAMAMVAGFSQDYPKSTYRHEFKRTNRTWDHGYAYKPRHSDVETQIRNDLTEGFLKGSRNPLPSPKELTVLGQLDDKRQVLTRKEQGFLRKHLLGARDHGSCFLCGEKLPVELLVTAHIKPRAQCSEKERRDWANIVPMCILGCDALFERGHVVVIGDRLEPRLDDLIRGSRLGAILEALRGRRISIGAQQHKYFEWHSKHSR